MNPEITRFLMELSFIHFIESLFIVTFIAIRLKIEVVNAKNVYIAMSMAVLSFLVLGSETPVIFFTERIIYAFLLAFIFNIFYDNKLNPKEIIKSSFLGLILMFSIETFVMYSMIVLGGLDIDSLDLKNNLPKLLLISSPSRVAEYFVLYLIYLRGRSKTNKIKTKGLGYD